MVKTFKSFKLSILSKFFIFSKKQKASNIIENTPNYQYAEIRSKVDQLKGILKDNIEKVMIRDEKLDVLREKTSELEDTVMFLNFIKI